MDFMKELIPDNEPDALLAYRDAVESMSLSLIGLGVDPGVVATAAKASVEALGNHLDDTPSLPPKGSMKNAFRANDESGFIDRFQGDGLSLDMFYLNVLDEAKMKVELRHQARHDALKQVEHIAFKAQENLTEPVKQEILRTLFKLNEKYIGDKTLERIVTSDSLDTQDKLDSLCMATNRLILESELSMMPDGWSGEVHHDGRVFFNENRRIEVYDSARGMAIHLGGCRAWIGQSSKSINPQLAAREAQEYINDPNNSLHPFERFFSGKIIQINNEEYRKKQFSELDLERDISV